MLRPSDLIKHPKISTFYALSRGQLSMILLSMAFFTGTSQGQMKTQVSVTAEPEKGSFTQGADLSFRFSITNNWEQHTLSFSTCPPPYQVELLDSGVFPVPQSDSYLQQMQNGVYVCESTVMIEIKPGETWGPAVWPTPDRGMFDLKPGTYTGRLLWHFTVYKNSAGSPRVMKDMSVPSNTFRFAVTPQS